MHRTYNFKKIWSKTLKSKQCHCKKSAYMTLWWSHDVIMCQTWSLLVNSVIILNFKLQSTSDLKWVRNLECRTVGQIGQKCKETSNLMLMSHLCLFTHIWWVWIHWSMHCNFLGSVGLQETHMDALKPFNSKLVTLTRRGVFVTKITALAHGVA